MSHLWTRCTTAEAFKDRLTQYNSDFVFLMPNGLFRMTDEQTPDEQSRFVHKVFEDETSPYVYGYEAYVTTCNGPKNLVFAKEGIVPYGMPGPILLKRKHYAFLTIQTDYSD